MLAKFLKKQKWKKKSQKRKDGFSGEIFLRKSKINGYLIWEILDSFCDYGKKLEYVEWE